MKKMRHEKVQYDMSTTQKKKKKKKTKKKKKKHEVSAT